MVTCVVPKTRYVLCLIPTAAPVETGEGLVILDDCRQRKRARTGSYVQVELAAVSQDRMRTSAALRIRRFL